MPSGDAVEIASIEIPPLEETLIAWLERQPPARLAELGLDAGDIDERAFYPRLTLGSFFKDQFEALLCAPAPQAIRSTRDVRRWAIADASETLDEACGAARRGAARRRAAMSTHGAF